MGAESKIEWTDATFNAWIGCTEVGPGCVHCYARELAKRYGWADWGPGKPRHRTASSTWRQPLQWDATPFYECRTCGARGDAKFMIGKHNAQCPDRHVVPARRRVFCASLADVFDNEVDPAWRADLFALIARTQNLDWLIVTKRIGNARAMIGEAVNTALVAPTGLAAWPWPNVWLGATVVNQEEADRDIPKLLATPAEVRFLSMEPLLDRVTPLLSEPACATCGGRPAACAILGHRPADDRTAWARKIDWVIVGGESGHGARPPEPAWVRALRDQCHAARVPFLFKQWGEYQPAEPPAGSGMDEIMVRVGKKAAGRHLDGRTWDQFPTGVANAPP